MGALNAALTALPTVPQDAPMACGVGTETHSKNFALSVCCASRINQKLNLNAAASFVSPSQDYQGGFNEPFSARAGFMYQFGKEKKSTLISMKEKKEFQAKIDNLTDKNKKLETLIAMQNKLLETLERIALGNSQAKDLASKFYNFSQNKRVLYY